MKKSMLNSTLLSLLLQPFSFVMSSVNNADYPTLYSNQSSSENYELVKIIDGKITGILFNEQSREFIVEANKVLWKIDLQGVVIDKINREQRFFASGYAFDLEGYNDWIYSGDPYKKKYQRQLDARDYNLAELFTLFDSAEIVEFSQKREKSYAHLYDKTGATLVDISGRSELIHNRCDIDERRYTNMGWGDVCFEGYKRNKNLTIISDSLIGYHSSLSPQTPPPYLQAIKFKKRKYHLEEGLSGQLLAYALYPVLKGLPGELPDRYWYGDGYFNLQQQGEVLKFKAFTNNQDRHNQKNTINHSNIRLFKPPTLNSEPIKLLQVSYLHDQHLEQSVALNELYSKEVGLYIVRKKGVDPKSIHYTRNAKWRVSYSGMKPAQNVTGYIFLSGVSHPEKFFIAGVSDHSTFYNLPNIISIDWFNKNKREAFELQVNETNTLVFQDEQKKTQVSMSIQLDQTELHNAFNKLSKMSASKKKDTIINLQIQFNKLAENKAQLKLVLLAHGQEIELKQLYFSFWNLKNKNNTRIKPNKLKVVYEASINGGSLDDVFEKIEEHARKADFIEEYLSYSVYLLTLLINHYNLAGDFQSSKAVSLYYANNLQPLLIRLDASRSAHINHYVIISQSLAAAVNTNDLSFQQQALSMLGENFNIDIVTNATLTYNLACYHAVNSNKEAMISAIKRSRELGKPTSQFLADTDFSAYYTDMHFLKAIE